MAAALALSCFNFWQLNRVGHGPPKGGVNLARLAHAVPLPNGAATRYASHVEQIAWFPAPLVRADVERIYGKNALPVALSYSEELAAYYPFYLYEGTGGFSANTLSFWLRRNAELHRLAEIRDPSAFATATKTTAFGAIDVFVLKAATNGDVVWQSVHFRRSQFSPTYFASFDEPERTVVYVRLGARVSHRSYPQ
jgi:hypothetical protein